jgi:hypothetical protein
MTMLYRLAAVTLACSLLISCSEETAFSDFRSTATTTTASGGGGGDGGTGGTGGGGANNGGGGATTNFSNVTLMSRIKFRISDGAGGDLAVIPGNLYMGNSDSAITYTVSDTIGSTERLFKLLPGGGQVELYSSNESLRIEMSGDGNKLLSWNNRMDIIDFDTTGVLGVGTALTIGSARSITDAGDLILVGSPEDPAGANAAGVGQLFTLATDGSEIYNQITNFTNSYSIVAWEISGDGSKAFFHSTDDIIGDGSNADGSIEVFSINTDGTGLTQLTDLNTVTVSVGEMSSDGSIITLTTYDASAGSTHLYTLDTVTSNLTEIVSVASNTNISIEHDLSSDGSKLIYTFSNDLMLVNPDGTSPTSVLTYTGTLRDLSTNSNGTQVTFMSNMDFGKDIGADEHSTQIYTLTIP